jgi:NAD(P)-dependent dehydrogenase (short-subunit alcohol dehydrogenase family)
MQDRPAARVVIVTGASTGIGRAMAVAFGALGDAVVVGYRSDEAGAAATCAAVRDAGGQAIAVRADVAVTADSETLVAQALAEFGRLDVLCANAGEMVWRMFLDTSDIDLDLLLATNIRGTYVSARAAARQMVAQGEGGRIILTSSIQALLALPGASAYAMTRAAMLALARNLALELGPHRITVNAILPGPILNDRNLRDDPEYAERWASVLPVGRVGQPGDVAALARFLASDEASFITGSAFSVDGGMNGIAVGPDLAVGGRASCGALPSSPKPEAGDRPGQ